jgi:hypothetical protein
MARITPPIGKTWNQVIQEAADAAVDQSATGRRLAKRNVKLGQIADVERALPAPSLRTFRTYNTPGTVAPTAHRPWA